MFCDVEDQAAGDIARVGSIAGEIDFVLLSRSPNVKYRAVFLRPRRLPKSMTKKIAGKRFRLGRSGAASTAASTRFIFPS